VPFLLGIASLIMGSLCLLNRDIVWEIKSFFDDLSGHMSNRTETWETGTIVTGWVMTLLGIAVLAIAMFG
jgi:hypothetical protein